MKLYVIELFQPDAEGDYYFEEVLAYADRTTAYMKYLEYKNKGITARLVMNEVVCEYFPVDGEEDDEYRNEAYF